MFRLPLTDPVRDYEPLAHFLKAARARPELWRTVAGICIATAVYVGAIVAAVSYANASLDRLSASVMLDAVASGRSPVGMTALFFTFVPMALGIFAAARLLQERPPSSIFGPKRTVFVDFVKVSVPLILLSVAFLPLTTSAETVGRHLTLAQQAVWLPLALPGLLIQTGAEEIAFRGYLLQQLAVRFRSPLVWMVVPSLAFGALHYSPEAYGANALAVAAWAVIFGLFASDLAARTGSLGAPIGFHFATNFSALFLVGQYGNLDGLALYNIVIDLTDPAAVLPFLAVDFVSLVVFWLLARLVLRV